MADNDRLTIKAARASLAELGYSLRKTGYSEELRVAPKHGSEAQKEACAYYTNDLADAVATAKAERSREAFREGGLDAAINRVMRQESNPAPRDRDPETRGDYPAERMIDRFAGITRSTDADNER